MRNISRHPRKTVRLLCVLLSVMLCVVLAGCKTSKGYDYQLQNPEEGDTIAILHTSMGDITVRFFPEEAPKAVENFVTHAREGYYDGVEFFRVIDDFMIQSGDPTNTGTGGESIWGGYFEDEIVEYLTPYYGALCMANFGAYTNTNTSQFFIVTCKDTDISKAEACNEKAARAERVDQAKLDMYATVGGAIWLDSQVGTLYETYYTSYTASAHTVFGQVIEGMDVAEAIAAVPTYTEVQETDAKIDDPDETEILENKPREPVTINSIEVTTYQGSD